MFSADLLNIVIFFCFEITILRLKRDDSLEEGDNSQFKKKSGDLSLKEKGGEGKFVYGGSIILCRTIHNHVI